MEFPSPRGELSDNDSFRKKKESESESHDSIIKETLSNHEIYDKTLLKEDLQFNEYKLGELRKQRTESDMITPKN